MNKMIKSAMMMASIGAMFCIVGCGGDGSPDSVAKDVISCLKSADLEGVCKYSTEEFKKEIGEIMGMMALATAKDTVEFKNRCANAKVEIRQAVVNGDKATVPVKINGTEKSIGLTKIEGRWLVAEFHFL